MIALQENLQVAEAERVAYFASYEDRVNDMEAVFGEYPVRLTNVETGLAAHQEDYATQQ